MFLPFTKDVIMELQFVHIAEADDVLVSQAIHSVLDVLPDDSPVPERMWSRVAAIPEGNYPAAFELLVVHNKAVGWSGWFPVWTNPYSTWSSATYLARRLRGRGLLPVLRCRQIHIAEQLTDELDNDLEFVSSIDTTNLQSLKASLRYAKSSGWPNEWYLREDADNNRMLARLVWPAAKNMKHNCFVGMDLPQFEDVLEEPDLDIFETENLRLNPKRWFGLV